MTPRQADRIIKKGEPVTFYEPFEGRTFTRVFVRRDRWNIYTEQGEKLDRGELTLVTT